VYRVRFMPDKAGEWRLRDTQQPLAVDGHSGVFTAVPPSPGNHGPVRVHNTYHFAYADGTPYRQIGTTCYTWTHAPEQWQELTLKTLATSPFNKVRMLVFPQDQNFNRRVPPPTFPLPGTPPDQWDHTRFNPEFFRNLEKRVGQLRDLGHRSRRDPLSSVRCAMGFDYMGRRERRALSALHRARLAAYRNVWWSMATNMTSCAPKPSPTGSLLSDRAAKRSIRAVTSHIRRSHLQPQSARG